MKTSPKALGTRQETATVNTDPDLPDPFDVEKEW